MTQVIARVLHPWNDPLLPVGCPRSGAQPCARQFSSAEGSSWKETQLGLQQAVLHQLWEGGPGS